MEAPKFASAFAATSHFQFAFFTLRFFCYLIFCDGNYEAGQTRWLALRTLEEKLSVFLNLRRF